MRRSMVVLALVVAPFLGAGEIVQGTVVHQGEALPGSTVQLKSIADTRTAVSDAARGRRSSKF